MQAAQVSTIPITMLICGYEHVLLFSGCKQVSSGSPEVSIICHHMFVSIAISNSHHTERQSNTQDGPNTMRRRNST